MEPRSSNFRFLATHDAQLDRLGALAERYFADDPNTCLIKLRQLAELLAQHTAAGIGVMVDEALSFNDLLRQLRFEGRIDGRVLDIFHQLRRDGNDAAHSFGGDHRTALADLKLARQLGIWFYRSIGRHRDFKPAPFAPPTDPAAETEALRAELARLREDHEAQLSAAERAAAHSEEERRLRLSEAERARQEAADRALWEELAQEAEARAASLTEELAALRAAAQTMSGADVADAVERASEAADQLDLDELETRRMIDQQLRDAGWEADTQQLRYAGGTRPQNGRSVAIAEWPTSSGPADYLLFVGLQPVAAVEAKRRRIEVSGAIDQAERYARDISIEGGMATPGGPWSEYRLPFAFATNGRPYLRQLDTKSGVWFRDLRRPQNVRRALEGWYTPEGLQDLLRQDLDAADARLREEPFAYGFPLRDYQIRAIEHVENSLAEGERDLLLAMATGTGKTKTAIALVYRLLKTRRFRRVLFLVDRSALGQQAEDAFKTTRVESLQTFADIFGLMSLGDKDPVRETRVQIATIQGMVHRLLFTDEPQDIPPVDQYDCLVVDECHRGYLLDREMSETELTYRSEADYISKYRRVLDHFDAVRIGLTATPALHTTQIFGRPTYTYSYREAVIDGWLIDYEPPYQLVTALNEAGITWARGEDMEVLDPQTATVDTVTLPDEVTMEVETFNRQVITQNFNRTVCTELARNIDPTLPGKTLVFCVNDSHADLVVAELKRAFEDAYGEIEDDMVMKITGAADRPRQLIRQFKNERNPRVAVTVDLLTTGIDVPEITNLVFIRRVNSRILYEQMLGRATRLCDEIGKQTFRVFDAVRLYEALAAVNTMRPVAVDPSLTFSDLVGHLLAAPDEPAREEARDQIRAKLQRMRRHRAPATAERLQRASGLTLDGLIAQLGNQSGTEAQDWFRAHGEVASILDADEGQGQTARIAISHHEDELRRVDRGYGDGQRPEDYLDSFAAFLRDNLNQLPALLVVTQRPRDLTRQQLRELVLALDEAGFGELKLRTAWRDAKNEDIAASIIGFIRQAALGDPLEPYDARVDRAMRRILAGQQWTNPQRRWLDRIANQIKQEVIVDREALDAGQFRQEGGFRRLNKVFEGRLEALLGEINEAIWAEAS